MAILSVTELLDHMPGVVIGLQTIPTTEQTEHIISRVESDLHALLAGHGVAWPADSTPAADYLMQTLVEGAKAQVLRAKYSMTDSSLEPAEITRSMDEYERRLKDLPKIAAAMRDTGATAATGGVVPLVLGNTGMPTLSGSFDAYSAARDDASVLRYGYRVQQ